ncbi:MAG: hypothetical protein J3K34DRAFT_201356 [Monoraphidium minutum]|nr:MAG: hypothetical protein J3K34DRAFT_201356 [Monoraphidium minutum]
MAWAFWPTPGQHITIKWTVAVLPILALVRGCAAYTSVFQADGFCSTSATTTSHTLGVPADYSCVRDEPLSSTSAVAVCGDVVPAAASTRARMEPVFPYRREYSLPRGKQQFRSLSFCCAGMCM